MARIDINNNQKKWEDIKKKEISKGTIKGLSKHNSEIAIKMLTSYEMGIDTTQGGKIAPASLLRIRYSFQKINKALKRKDFESLTRKQASELCDKYRSSDFVKNLKSIYSWMYRKRIIKENVCDHIRKGDYSKGKPKWVYFNEKEFKRIINAGNADFRTIATFKLDSGIRPQEGWLIKVKDFSDDFTVLEIPDKRENGRKVAKTFSRKIKLKMCSGLIKDYVKRHKLTSDDFLIQVTQAGFNKTFRSIAERLFGKEPTKAGDSPDKASATDIRHIASCFWLIRYPKHNGLMYRMGWKKHDRIFYYSEFLNLRDTIDDDDMVTQEDKNRYEKQFEKQDKKIKLLMRFYEDFQDVLNEIAETGKTSIKVPKQTPEESKMIKKELIRSLTHDEE